MILNYFKIGAIRLTDLLNRLYDPFKEFTRPAQEKDTKSLQTRAFEFEDDMLSNFITPDGIFTYKRTVPYDLGDQALWHGIYTAMWAFRHSVTKEWGSLSLVEQCVRGMWLHQRTGKLIRGVSGAEFRDDASNDTATGHLAGIYFAQRYARVNTSDLAAAFAVELTQNNFCLVNQDGTPTTYGRLVDGWKTDPLRVSLCLAILKVAGNPAYEEIARKYWPLVKYAKVRLWNWGKIYDTHRAAIHLTILADLETGSRKQDCIDGLKRIYKDVRKSGNPWVLFLCGRHIDIDPVDLENARKLLSEFTLEDKMTTEKVNSTRTDIEKIKWDGEWCGTQPVPVWQRGAQDFLWQRNVYSLDNWVGNTWKEKVYNGGDFLAAYWLGKAEGLL